MDRKDKKDEIISLQNSIMQDLLSKQMRQLSSDLWGINRELKTTSGMPEVPDISPLFKISQSIGNAGKSGNGSDAPVMKKTESGDSVHEKAKEEAAEKKDEKEEEPPENIEDLKAELHGYIGLDTIKDEVESLINWIDICKKRREMGLKTPDLSLHMVFSGNPGTGKTMVARLMSRIYKSLGLLSKGHLIEVDRSCLVAGYVGQTAIKTQEVIQKSLGGVLFIDEAYALTNRGANDYGQEAVDTILKAMEDNRDDLIVIVAGYTELMEEFVHSNPGLESRFNRFMHFPDYTLDELDGIFKMRCSGSGYILAEDANETLRDILDEKRKDIDGFGNARGVRNLFETAIAKQADRLCDNNIELTRENLMTITREDLNKAAGRETPEDTLDEGSTGNEDPAAQETDTQTEEKQQA